MATLMQQPPTPQATPAAGWSETTRGLISFALFLHFFVVLVGVTANWNSSQLERDLRRRLHLEPYLQLLGLDNSYTDPFYLTYAGDRDVQHFVELEVPGEDGQPARTVRFPPLNIRPSIRYIRYERLAERATTLSQDETFGTVEGVLPQALAGRMLREQGAERGVIRFRVHYLQSIAAPSSNDPEQRDPNSEIRFHTVYAAHVWTTEDGVQLLKQESQRDAAPAASSGAAKL